MDLVRKAIFSILGYDCSAQVHLIGACIETCGGCGAFVHQNKAML